MVRGIVENVMMRVSRAREKRLFYFVTKSAEVKLRPCGKST